MGRGMDAGSRAVRPERELEWVSGSTKANVSGIHKPLLLVTGARNGDLTVSRMGIGGLSFFSVNVKLS